MDFGECKISNRFSQALHSFPWFIFILISVLKMHTPTYSRFLLGKTEISRLQLNCSIFSQMHWFVFSDLGSYSSSYIIH